MASRGDVWRGTVRQRRLGESELGVVWQGLFRQARWGTEARGAVCLGRLGGARQRKDRLVQVRQARRGLEWKDWASSDLARQVRLVSVW